MASIIVVPLNNGITPTNGATLVGMLTLNAGVSPAYLYYDTQGDIYYQIDAATPSTLLLSAGFAITCVDFIFDGTVFNIFMGGSGGNYIWGSIDPTGISTLAPLNYGSTNFTAVTFNVMLWCFIVGTVEGNILNVDLTTGSFTPVAALPTTGLPSGSTLKVSNFKYDLTTDAYLITCVASTNINPDYADPVDIAAKALTNFSVVFYGKLDNLVSQPFQGSNLPFGAIGTVENSLGAKVTKLVVAGEDCKIFHSDTGTSWERTILVDQALQINSLTFNTWVFVGGLIYGIVLMSTNGISWESSYDAQLSSDILDVKAA